MSKINISILGVTGSIGTQTLDVIRKSKEEINLIGITANTSVEKMKEIISEFKPKYVGMMDKKFAEEIRSYCLESNFNIKVLHGIEGLERIASLEEIQMVVTSIVGMIGLKPTIKAIEAGKDIALANKETLVVAGEIVMRKAKENGVRIYPVDSEHSAIFQSLSGYKNKDINKIILTASGGPFRGKDKMCLEDVTVEEALKHPKWNMGKKISIDSATLMNKGLEVIEAHFLFDCPYDNIDVVVHPQSIIHSMVEYKDASIIAQMGSPDMRLPIQYALNKTERKEQIANSINLHEIAQLTFEKPDFDTFTCLKLAYEAGAKGGLTPTILNGANEEAVALFLEEKIRFIQIPEIIKNCMDRYKKCENQELTIDNIISLDKIVKEFIRSKWG